MRDHLIKCFEDQDFQPFSVYRQSNSNNTKKTPRKKDNTPTWTNPRRSARLSKKKANTLDTPTANRFSALDFVNEMDDSYTFEKKDKATVTIEQPNLLKIPKVTKKFTSIVNLSDTRLIEDEVSVLEKGFEFFYSRRKSERM